LEEKTIKENLETSRTKNTDKPSPLDRFHSQRRSIAPSWRARGTKDFERTRKGFFSAQFELFLPEKTIASGTFSFARTSDTKEISPPSGFRAKERHKRERDMAAIRKGRNA
jgi:hypothetical protein